MDLLNDLKNNLYNKHPSTKGYFEDIAFQYAKAIFSKRIELGFTQQELADNANLSLETIAKIEAGSKKITMETYDKIFKALDISSTELSKSIVELNEGNNQISATI